MQDQGSLNTVYWRHVVLVGVLILTSGFASAADWPAWRYDAGRTAAAPAPLPDSLHLQWVVEYSPRDTVWDSPLNDDLMRYDRVFEPIVVGHTLLMGFNDTDKLVALDTESGQEKWRFYVSGPVRMPPVAGAGRVYFVSDDGWLYCLRIEDGSLLWKYRGGPSDRKILGNERLVSSWPARGAPVLCEGTVYFAASIWPLMGTIIYALDAETGKVQWINDGTSAQYIDQPHNYPAFAGVAPQGNLVISEDALIVPGGRSIPACFDRHTGQFRYFHLAKYGKYGGSWVFANAHGFFAHIRGGEYLLYNLDTGLGTKVRAWQPVLTDDSFYSSGESVVCYRWQAPSQEVWKLDVDATGDLIRAGNRLYAAGSGHITAIDDTDISAPRIAWQKSDLGNVERLVAADDKLFAITLDGRILAFGENSPVDDDPLIRSSAPVQLTVDAESKRTAASILRRADVQAGYSLFYGVGDGKLLEALALESDLHIVAIDPDAKKVDALRRKYDAAGLHGDRIALLVGNIYSFETPPYMSSLTVLHDAAAVEFADSSESVQRIFESLRPYGGVAFIAANSAHEKTLAQSIQKADLARAILDGGDDFVTITRAGSLPGAGQWTHQYGNSANTVKSDDQRVKLPLGVLWFGGSSNMDVLPRHGHGPPEQIIGGRLFIEGMDCLSARDVYTGRVLWKVALENLDNFGVYYDETYENLPLTLQYNQVHIPGANVRGTNYVATLDRVYIVEGNRCRVLDSATGETLRFISMRDSDGHSDVLSWGYLAVHGDALVGGAEFATLSRELELPHEKDPKDSKSKWRFTDFDKAASHELVVMDRFSGEERWRIAAGHGFLHNAIAIADGKLFCIDKLPRNVEKRLARRGQQSPQADYRLLVLDLDTGEMIWRTSENVFGSWLSYSTQHDLLLQSSRPSSDTVRDETGSRMIVYHADSGQVVWDKPVEYNTPPILHGDDIITGSKRYSLLTGEPRYRIDPLTGERRPWSYVSTKGCNYPIASENLLTFRSSAAAFYDLLGDAGTGHFGGFKSGCTSNLIAADGVLNAPDYTRTCRCSFQNQTSLALVHMPDLELWTHNDFSYKRDRVVRAGINFGAPGDRRSTGGTLWMDMPSVGGPSPDIAVDVEGPATYFRNHMSRVRGDGIPWVAASGIEGADKLIIHLAGGAHKFDGSRRIAVSADDASESSNGRMYLNSKELRLASGDGKPQIGLRFIDLPIPQDAVITTAAIQFTVGDDNDEVTKLTIFGQDSDDAAIFRRQTHDISNRPKTEQFVTWEPAEWPLAGEAGPPHRTPELVSILQGILDRPGWKPGNAVAFMITGTGQRVVKSFDAWAKQAPSLQVEFEAPDSDIVVSTMESRVPTRSYTVRLQFAEPQPESQPGERVFDVALQGQPVLNQLDVVAEAGGPHRSVVKEFTGVRVADELAITFTPSTGRKSIICGVEIMVE